MAGSDKYQALIFQLGDVAREHLAESPKAPDEMQEVFACEDVVLARRDELAAVEEEMNRRDEENASSAAALNAEIDEQKAMTSKWRTAVQGVERRSRDLKKRLSAQKATFRSQRISLSRAEASHKDLEMRQGHDAKKVDISKENLKRFRLRVMRLKRDLEDLEAELTGVLTPRPGQVGADGILAHRRILECEDQLADEKADHDEALAQLDAQAEVLEADIKDAEAALDDAVFALGEAVLAQRPPHPLLVALYAKGDRLK